MRIKLRSLFVSFAAAAILSAGVSPSAEAQAAGKITGKIVLKGASSDPIKIKMAEPACMKMNPNGAERRQIDGTGGGLANVVVSIKSPVKGAAAPLATPVILDQQGCMYAPPVLALQVGQPLKIRNSDETMHNVHPRPAVNAGWNIGQPRKGMETEKKFDKAETIFPVSCDVHPWMRSYIAVFDHPYFAITKPDGTFEIGNVPPGDYEIQAEHPTLKIMTGKVSVKAGGAGNVEITFVSK
jgi:plastocyanin